MLRLPIDVLEPGMVLAKPVIDSRGSVLLRQGVTLTDEYISNIRKRGFASVFISDGDTDDVIIEDILSDYMRRTTQSTLAKIYDFSRHLCREFIKSPGETVIASLKDSDITTSLQNYNGFEKLEERVTGILEDLSGVDMLAGIGQVRSHSDIILGHSIDTTVVALMIGKRLHLKIPDLRRLGIGCLLHDIGKIFVDDEVLNTSMDNTKKLSPAMQLRLKDHPRLGYELLRTRNSDAAISNHIALQHHERQDGRGYPRRLYGTNTIERPKFDRQNIQILAEIATIADTYDILSTERPGQPALTPSQVIKTIRQLAGTFLNTEIVEEFLHIVPLLPTGISIVVRAGRYVGYRGVVVHSNKKKPDHPLIRLLYNPNKDRIVPIEIDLSKDKTTTVEAIVHQ